MEEAHSFGSALATIFAAAANTLSEIFVGLIGFGAVSLVIAVNKRTETSPMRYVLLPVIGLPCFAVALVALGLLIRDAIDLGGVIVWAAPRYIIGSFDAELPGFMLLIIGGVCVGFWIAVQKTWRIIDGKMRYPSDAEKSHARKSELSGSQRMPSIAGLAQEIFMKSIQSAEAVKPYIYERLGKGSQESSYKWVEVLYEFTYFFMHLASRIAKEGFGEERGAILQSKLADLVVGPTVEAVFGRAPPDLKAGMKNEFYKNLNRAEEEYTKCTELLAGTDGKTIAESEAKGEAMMQGLINQLAYNIARILDQQPNWFVIARVKDVMFAAVRTTNLVELVRAAGKEL